MSTQISSKAAKPFSKMVFKLWLMMMTLVVLTVWFMWMAQIMQFDNNYVNAAVTDIGNRLDALEPRIQNADLKQDRELFFSLGAAVNSKMLLGNSRGELIGAFSFGYQLDLENDSSLSNSWQDLLCSDDYQYLLSRESFIRMKNKDTRQPWLRIGMPVTYGGEKAYVLLSHSLADLYSVLDVNRRQLVMLMLVLTAAASVLAVVLARRFTKPILVIKDTVDALAEGDLDAAPNLRRNDELGQLSDSVTTLGVKLKQVDVLRKEVIANVSHELRAPLALIGGYAEMVRDITWKEEKTRNEGLDLIIHEAKRMTEMVGDILDYSQLQAGYLPLKPDVYNLYDIVETETDNCQPGAVENNVTLTLHSDGTDYPMRLDALKMSQVIRNLLYNAINHTRDGGSITVSIQKKAEAVRVSVINPGEPIPVEERKLIWERYQRSQHQGGRKQGTGIGLSIVSAILAAHGMPYGVDCADGLIVFWFECPKAVWESDEHKPQP